MAASCVEYTPRECSDACQRIANTGVMDDLNIFCDPHKKVLASFIMLPVNAIMFETQPSRPSLRACIAHALPTPHARHSHLPRSHSMGDFSV